MSNKKTRTIAQQAGTIRAKLRRQGIETIRDHKGQDAPLDYIPNLDLVEHMEAIEIIQEAVELRDRLAAFKHRVQTAGDAIFTQHLNDSGVEDQDIKNYRLTSLDKECMVVFKRPPKYTKDEKELAISRDYKKKFFEDVAEEIPEYLVDLLEELMEDSRGDIDQGKLAKLNQLAQKIKNKNFQQMVKHFNQCLEAYYAKRYERFLRRDSQGGEESIVINYAPLMPVDPQALTSGD